MQSLTVGFCATSIDPSTPIPDPSEPLVTGCQGWPRRMTKWRINRFCEIETQASDADRKANIKDVKSCLIGDRAETLIAVRRVPLMNGNYESLLEAAKVRLRPAMVVEVGFFLGCTPRTSGRNSVHCHCVKTMIQVP